jgi:hypothetical protein
LEGDLLFQPWSSQKCIETRLIIVDIKRKMYDCFYYETLMNSFNDFVRKLEFDHCIFAKKNFDFTYEQLCLENYLNENKPLYLGEKFSESMS